MNVFPSKNNWRIDIIKYSVLFIPALVYFHYVYKYAVNIPSLDDYGAILDFLCKYKAAQGMDKFFMLFSQHNEHRILSSRIVYILYYSIFGTINFRSIIFIGNFQLVLVYCILIFFIKKCLPKYWFIASLVAGISLFNLCNWENADFAMACMQNYGIFLWISLSLLCYSRPANKYLIAAIFFQVICIYSSGNGIIAATMIALYNIFSGNKLKIILSISALIIFAPLYFIHYNTPSTGHPSTDILKICVFFLSMLSAVAIFGNFQAIALGLLVLVILAVVIPVSKKMRINADILPIVCLAGFIMASMAITAIFRCNVTGVPPNSSRYMIYPQYFFVVIFIFTLYRFREKKKMLLIPILYTLVALIAYNMNFRWGIDNIAGLQHSIKTNEYNFPDKETAKSITQQACRMNIYCIQNYR